MGFFKRSETARAKKISARARYVDEDVQRVDISITNDAGETATIDLSLDQTRQLVIDLTNAYGACRPALLDQKQSIASRRSSGCAESDGSSSEEEARERPPGHP